MAVYNSTHTGTQIDSILDSAFLKSEASTLSSTIDSTYLKITDAANTYAPLDGVGTSGIWPIRISGASGFVSCSDTRDKIPSPFSLHPSRGISFDLKTSEAIGLTTAPFSGVMSFRPYGSMFDWSCGPAHQIAFNEAGIYARKSTDNRNWSEWKTLITY